MQLITRTPTLTGVALGGTIIRPAPATMVLGFGIAPQLRTLWICRVTLAPPIEGPMPQLLPTLLTTQHVSPAAG
jgi:hypothetical protein